SPLAPHALHPGPRSVPLHPFGPRVEGPAMYRAGALAALGAAALLLSPVAAPSAAHDKKESMGASLHRPDGLTWQDGPPSLPPGAKIAVLEGDPTKPGPFVFRVKVPDGYRIPSHTHPKPERVTVVSGTFHIGMRDSSD